MHEHDRSVICIRRYLTFLQIRKDINFDRLKPGLFRLIGLFQSPCSNKREPGEISQMKEKAKGSDDTLSGGKWTGLIGWVGSFKVHFVTLQ